MLLPLVSASFTLHKATRLNFAVSMQIFLRLSAPFGMRFKLLGHSQRIISDVTPSCHASLFPQHFWLHFHATFSPTLPVCVCCFSPLFFFFSPFGESPILQNCHAFSSLSYGCIPFSLCFYSVFLEGKS